MCGKQSIRFTYADHGLTPTLPVEAAEKGETCVVVMRGESCWLTEVTVRSKQFVL